MVGVLIFVLTIVGAAMVHRMETVRAILLTINILVVLQSCVFAVIKLLISSNIVEHDKVYPLQNTSHRMLNGDTTKDASESSSISEERCFTLNRKWMTHYVPYTITIGNNI